MDHLFSYASKFGALNLHAKQNAYATGGGLCRRKYEGTT